ncbi:thiamine pyrophosphate-dependent enzyme, partial [Mycolicibacterium diernhoferi]
EQRAAEYAVWQTSLRNPDFAAFARNCGAHGVRVEDPADLSVAITRALDHRGPALVEIITDPQSR